MICFYGAYICYSAEGQRFRSVANLEFHQLPDINAEEGSRII